MVEVDLPVERLPRETRHGTMSSRPESTYGSIHRFQEIIARSAKTA